MTLKIGIDAGHGYYTSGKRTPDGEREWAFNDKVVKAFIEEMRNYVGVEVKRFDDPTGKTDVPLSTRTNGAKSWGADIYVSVHHNANTGKWGSWGGTETHVYLTRPSESVELARVVQDALVKAYGLRDRGIKYTNLHITRELKHIPVVLTEGGFMDSTTDIKKMRDNKVLEKAGVELAKAVASYGKAQRKATGSTSKPKSHTIEKGDTFSGIAKKYGMKLSDVIAYNPRVKPEALQIGDVVHLVPVPNSVPKPVSPPKPKPAPKPVPKVETINGIEVAGNIKIVNLNNFTYIYSKDSDKSTRLGNAYKGKVFPISGSVSGWFEVIYNGKRAYVKDKYGKRV